MKRLHLIRHGQIPSNVTGALDTAIPGPALTPVGRAQAEALVENFSHVKLDAVWASTALRTQQTAQPLALAKNLDVNVLDGFREISAGDLEMSTNPTDRMAYQNTITQWILGDLDVRLANGTNGHEVLERFVTALDEVSATGAENVAVVAHGALISFWSGVQCTNLTEELFAQHPVVNTGVVSMEPTGSNWRATSWMGVAL